ncbi:phage holin family protein [Candidatus Saccharibacteria bacterium]|nr:phage holin family protein [Candidatus Saccharibacteria bacterium]
MRQIANFFITGIILWVAAWLFPQFVQIDSMKTLALAALLLFVAEVVVLLLFFALIVSAALAQYWAGVLVGMTFVFFAEIVALSLLDAWLPGLSIYGFWPKFLLAFALSVFRIQDNHQNY